MNKTGKISAIAFLMLMSCASAFAQQQSADKVDENTADIAITANVTAKELKFETVPNPQVEFPGTPERKTEWSSVRTNLPDQVQPNVIYRNIGITLKIASVFADIDKIVDDALAAPAQISQTEVAPIKTRKANTAKRAIKTKSKIKQS